MAQNYCLPPSRGQAMLHITDEDVPNTLDGKSAWDSGDVLQGIMDVDFSQHIDTSSYNNSGPAPASPPYEAGSHSHAVPFVSNSFNYTSFEQDSTPQGAWSSVRVTGIPENAIPRGEHKRQRINVPDVIMLGNFRQVNAHPTSDSGYATRSATSGPIIATCPTGDTIHSPMMDPLSWDIPQGHAPLQNQYACGGEQQQPACQGSTEAMPQVNDPQFPCDVAGCKWVGKCQSDKKKHMIRHKKGFHCKETGCSRKEGFGTINDLERHQSSVHKIEQKHGNIKKCKCFAKNCTKKDKIWPRFDNFKQHLKRMHKDEDTEELIQRSKSWYESTKQSILNSSEVHSLPTCSPQQEVINTNSYTSSALQDTTQLNNRQSKPCVYNGTFGNAPHYSPGIQVEGPGLLSHPLNYTVRSASVEAATYDFSSSLGEDYEPEGQEVIRWGDIGLQEDIGQPFERHDGDGDGDGGPCSPLLPEINQGHNPPSGFDSVTEAVLGLVKALGREIPNSRSEQPQIENGTDSFGFADGDAAAATSQLAKVSGIPSYVDLLNIGSRKSRDRALREVLMASLKHLDASQANTDVPPPENPPQTSKDDSLLRPGKKTFVCRHQGCTRETRRLSEMKKHEKRHSRPYGCTYPRCVKSFGSKNDWKRHENTQHFQLQCWRCPVKISEVANNDTLMEGPDRGDFPPAFHLDRTQIECARVFDRKDKFYHHLQSEHFFFETNAKETVKQNEIGRNGQFQFWCGFCRELIKLEREGLQAWDERFDHIDNKHFKKKQRISSWLHLEGHLTKKCEEEGDIAGDTSETSEEREGVEEEDTNCRSSSGGEQEPANGMGSAAPTVSIRNTTVSVQPPTANSNCGLPGYSPFPAAIGRDATHAARNANLTQPTKRKYAGSLASSPPSNNTVDHRTSSFNSAPMMLAPQQQITPGGMGGGYNPAAFNPFVANDGYVNVNGLIPIDNDFPVGAIITCRLKSREKL
ncbi:hypothetical protein EMCG_06391 [[Emmonsia] crescens]|uniref:C2H2-type domain-containing protein n=1 Tax=[Emmonsia] crescens TaxID=73230 RepID=A0A0G2IAZ9_9EURO|nr:hypothetical protein EMCG_06391 [Emmonsia crescens UAMH 3008]